MKWSQSFEIHIKKSLLDKIVSDNFFNDLTPRENRLIKIRDISHFDEKVNIFVDVLDFMRLMDSNIISRLVNIYKKDIDIYDHFWSDRGGYEFSSSIHFFYDDEVKWISLEEENVLGVDDRDTLIKLIKRNNESYVFIPDKYKYDVGFNLEVVDSFDFLGMLPDEMKLNRDILLKCLTNKGKYQDALELSLFENCDVKEMFIVAIKTDCIINCIPKVFWSDREFVLKVLDTDKNLIGEIYSLLSDELRIDDEIVDIYADYRLCDIKKLDRRVKKTDELVKKMIFSNLSNLKYTKFKNDVDFVDALLDNDFDVLEYTNKEIRNNYDIVLKSVKREPYSLKYASNELRNNYDIVLESVKKDPYSLKYASDELRNNYDIVLESVKKDPYLLKYASDELRNNKEIVELAVMSSYDSGTFMYAGDALKNNLEFIEKLLDNEYVVLEYCSDEIKNNYDIVLRSIKMFPYSLKYASDELRNNIDFVKCAVLYLNYDCKILECVGDKIKNDKDFMRDFFINCNCRFEFTDKRIRKYRRLFKLNNSDLIISPVISYDSDDIVGVMVKEFFCYMSNHLLEDLDYIQSLIDELLPFY